jgi:hypothetical protein
VTSPEDELLELDELLERDELLEPEELLELDELLLDELDEALLAAEVPPGAPPQPLSQTATKEKKTPRRPG